MTILRRLDDPPDLPDDVYVVVDGELRPSIDPEGKVRRWVRKWTGGRPDTTGAPPPSRARRRKTR